HGLSNTLEAAEPCPVGADAVRPGRQDHRLDGAADIRNCAVAFLQVCRDNRETRPRGVRTGPYQRAQLPQVLPLTDHDEMPGLTVASTGGEPSRIDDAVHDLIWHRLVLILAHGQDSANRLEYWIRHPWIISLVHWRRFG